MLPLCCNATGMMTLATKLLIQKLTLQNHQAQQMVLAWSSNNQVCHHAVLPSGNDKLSASQERMLSGMLTAYLACNPNLIWRCVRCGTGEEQEGM